MNDNEIRTMQLRIFEVFKAFQEVCEKHNLRFYIIAGTLLGAIRHKGFIPWDDDLDVGMPRKDYERLLENASEWFSYPYELDCREKNKKYPYRFAKVHDATTTLVHNKTSDYVGGIYIDVFPLDGLPDRKIRQKLHLIRHRVADKLFYFSIRDPFKRGKRFDSYLIILLQKIISKEKSYRRLKKVDTKYDFERSNFVSDHDFKLGGIVEKEVLGEEPVKILFENHETYGMRDCDRYLKIIYNDYMQIPPPEKRRRHFNNYLNLDLPYREYSRKC